MNEADQRLARQEKQKAIDRAQQAEQRAEQAEISKILKNEREEERNKQLLKMEVINQTRADKACESKELRLYRKAKRAESLASIRQGLVSENKELIARQKEHENVETIKRSDSAFISAQQNRMRLAERDVDTDKFDRQKQNYQSIANMKQRKIEERDHEL